MDHKTIEKAERCLNDNDIKSDEATKPCRRRWSIFCLIKSFIHWRSLRGVFN